MRRYNGEEAAEMSERLAGMRLNPGVTVCGGERMLPPALLQLEDGTYINLVDLVAEVERMSVVIWGKKEDK
jgi:hypothetical protein